MTRYGFESASTHHVCYTAWLRCEKNDKDPEYDDTVRERITRLDEEKGFNNLSIEMVLLKSSSPLLRKDENKTRERVSNFK